MYTYTINTYVCIYCFSQGYKNIIIINIKHVFFLIFLDNYFNQICIFKIFLL